MATKKLSSTEAFELAVGFREASVALGNYRMTNWANLKPAERQAIEDAEWSLLNASSDMITTAVGLVLDESELSLKQLQGATKKAKSAIKKLRTVRKVIGVATAAVGLAAAVISKDPGAIVKNAKAVYDAATSDA